MLRERIHHKLFASYVALICVFVFVGLWFGAMEESTTKGVLSGAAVALGCALLFAWHGGRDVGSALVRLSQAVRRLAAGEPPRTGELRRDGSAGDEIDDLAAALRELSRRLAEDRRSLVAEAARLRTVLDGMSEGVAMLSGGRIAFANPAFSRLLGVSSSVEGLTPLEAVRRYDLADAIAAAGSGAVPETRDIAVASGRVLQLRAAPLTHDAAVVVLLDVTEARSLERMRREFVANASHELRTPVAAIHAVAETLTSAPNMGEADRLRFERILLSHAERLGRLVKDLLDLSRAEAGRPPAAVAVDLVEPIASAITAVRERAEGKGIELTESVAPHLPAIAADATSVEQVLVNLLDNAVKYTPDGGRVELRAALAEALSGPVVRVEVEDNGIGIPPEHLPRLFERFYRVDAARSRELGGTGLGLAIVKHLVHSHGGDVSVRSRVGVGSTFIVTFRVMPAVMVGEPVAQAAKRA